MMSMAKGKRSVEEWKYMFCCKIQPDHHCHHLQKIIMTRTHHNGTHIDKVYVTRLLDEGRYFSLRQTITAPRKQVLIYQMAEGKLLKFQSKPVSINNDELLVIAVFQLFGCTDISGCPYFLFTWLLKALCEVCNWWIKIILFRNDICKVCSLTSMACKTGPLIISIAFISVHFGSFFHFSTSLKQCWDLYSISWFTFWWQEKRSFLHELLPYFSFSQYGWSCTMTATEVTVDSDCETVLYLRFYFHKTGHNE